MSSEPPSTGSKTKRPAPRTTTITTISSESPPPPPLGSSATDVDSTATPEAPPHKRVKHDARTREKMAQEATGAGVVAVDDEPQIDRGAPRAGGFRELLGDILSLVCTHLDTRDLVSMRRANQHWSRISRLPRSWVSSRWEFPSSSSAATWKRLVEMCAAAPHLRSLRLPMWPTSQQQVAVAGFRSLEVIHFGNMDPDARLIEQLPNLRHVTSAQGITGAMNCRPQLDALRSKEGLVSLEQVDEFAFARLLEGVSASTTLLSLTLVSSWGKFEMSRFSVLEVLDIRRGKMDPWWLANSLRALGSAPALRILTVQCDHGKTPISDRDMTALLSNPPLTKRLEYLAIKSYQFARAFMRRIVEECTSLLALHLEHDVERYHGTCYRSLTQEEWAIWQTNPDLDPSDVRDTIASASNTSTKVIQSNSPDLSLFLLGPSAFRQRLLSISLSLTCDGDNNTPSADVQLRRRMPNLVHADLQQTPPTSSAEVDKSHPWLDQVSSERPVAAHADQRQTTRDWSQQRLDDFRKLSPFQLVRRLKIMADLPLTPSEKDPNSRWI